MSARLVRSSSQALVSPSLAHGIGTGDFTMNAWVYAFNISDSWHAVWANGDFSPCMYWNAGGGTVWNFYWGGNHEIGLAALTLRQWYMLTAVRRSGVLTGYTNAVVAGNYAETTSMATGVQRIGYSGTGSEYADGLIGPVTLWKAALSPAEIRGLYGHQPALRTRPGSLVWHMRMRSHMKRDEVRGLTFTSSGNPRLAHDPPLLRPDMRVRRYTEEVAAGGTSVARLVNGGLVNTGLTRGRLVA